MAPDTQVHSTFYTCHIKRVHSLKTGDIREPALPDGELDKDRVRTRTGQWWVEFGMQLADRCGE